jgi:hypothetical protein
LVPLRVSAHWEAGNTPRAALGAAIFGILVACAVAGLIGFGMQSHKTTSGLPAETAEKLPTILDELDKEKGRASQVACASWSPQPNQYWKVQQATPRMVGRACSASFTKR